MSSITLQDVMTCDADLEGRDLQGVTVRQAAELVQVRRAVLYQAMAAGQLPHAVIHGAKHLRLRDLEAWFQRGR